MSELLQDRNHECESLAGSSDGLDDYIFVLVEEEGDHGSLDRGH